MQPDEECLDAVPMWVALPISMVDDAYVFETFIIPTSRQHEMTFDPPQDNMVLHVAIVQSDAPVTIGLVPSDGAVSELITADVQDAIAHLRHGTTRLQFHFAAGYHEAWACKRVTLQISLSSSSVTPHTLPDDDFKRHLVLGVLRATYYYDGSHYGQSAYTVVTFELAKAAVVRVTVEYDFRYRRVEVYTCKCAEGESSCHSDCTVGSHYANGLDIPAHSLAQGRYSVVLRSSRDTIAHSGVHLQMAAIFVEANDDDDGVVAASCSSLTQFLPPSLNVAGLLSPHYGNMINTHFDLRHPLQGLDMTVFHIDEPSVIRLRCESSNLMRVMNAVDNRTVASGGSNTGLSITLPRGRYRLEVHYPLWVVRPLCSVMPMDLAIVPHRTIAALESDDAMCASHKLVLPVSLAHPQHRVVYYRHPSEAFRVEIPVVVRGECRLEAGLDAHGALSLTSLRIDRSYGQVTSQGAIGVEDRLNRIYVNDTVAAGNLSILLRTPTYNYSEALSSAPSCVPFALTLRLTCGDDALEPPPPPPSPGAPPTPTYLPCPDTAYDPLPVAASSAPWYASSLVFRVPTATNAEQEARLTVALNLTQRDYLRVWASVPEHVASLSLRLRIGGPMGEVIDGERFSPTTATMVFVPSTNAPAVLELNFKKLRPPRRGIDYHTCEERVMLESFAALIAVVPLADVRQETHCTAEQLSQSEAERLPPKSIQLVDDVSSLQLYHFSLADMAPPAEAQNDDLPVSDTFTTIDARSSTILSIPLGTSPALFTASVAFDMVVANMRIELRNGTDFGDRVGSCEATPYQSGHRRIGACVMILTLAPGTYRLDVLEDNAEPHPPRDVFCVPFAVMLNIRADRYASGSTAAPVRGTYLVQYSPTAVEGFDISDPLDLRFTFSTAVRLRPTEGWWIRLQSPDGVVLPYSLTVVGTSTVVAHFSSMSLSWGTQYQIILNTASTRLVDEAGASVATTALPLNATVRTWFCGCLNGFCVQGGGCSCDEPDGEFCSECPTGYSITEPRIVRGAPGPMPICALPGETPPSSTRPPVASSPPTTLSSAPSPHFTYAATTTAIVPPRTPPPSEPSGTAATPPTLGLPNRLAAAFSLATVAAVVAVALRRWYTARSHAFRRVARNPNEVEEEADAIQADE